MNIELPWPPSLNAYYRTVNGRILISKQGRQYRKLVTQLAMLYRWGNMGKARLVVRVDVYPPDRRRRDLDNLLKVTLDALEKSGVYDDDGQIDLLSIRRMEQVQDGKLEIEITPIN